MSSAEARKAKTTPAPAPVIIKKVIAAHEHAHHGGAWKVAYADFVTAMMAFFLLLWIVGATNEDQRKGIADYFSPTLIQHTKSGGSNGVLAGRALLVPDGNAPHATPSGSQRITPIAALARPSAAETAAREKLKAEDNRKFEQAARLVDQKIMQRQELSAMRNQVQFILTEDGLRIDLVDEAAFSMFALSTSRLVPKAVSLLEEVSAGVAAMPNSIAIRGHTDSLPYPAPANMNNWLLSTERAESTRQVLERNGISPARFSRLEGVADREHFNKRNPADPKNRRISITLLYRQPTQIFKN
jgi:chemotaxis protein MotB